jgi:acyl-CoA synthetase (AMP-forming)/AMP-acid ligase II
MIAFYAASKPGAIACPLNSSYREREITCQLNDPGATISSLNEGHESQ